MDDILKDLRPATERQLRCLEEMGLDTSGPLTAVQASQLIHRYQPRWDNLSPTAAQVRRLQEINKWRPGLNRRQATALIQEYAKNNPLGHLY